MEKLGLFDSRGGRLDRYEVMNSGRVLRLRCQGAIAMHIDAVVGSREKLRAIRGSEWTHLIALRGNEPSGVRDFLELMTALWTVPGCRGVDATFALDLYTTPDGTADVVHSEVGELVHRAKYWRTDPSEPKRSGTLLADLMADKAMSHPWMQRCEFVVAVPSSRDPNKRSRSISEPLAAGVARRIGAEAVVAELTSSTSASAAKEGHSSGDRRIFAIEQSLHGADALVIDDVYRSGTTLGGVAEATRVAGARRVVGLVAARTLRK